MESGYKNINNQSVLDINNSRINDNYDRIILNDNFTEGNMVRNSREDMCLMKIEQDNFLDNNILDSENFIISRRRFGKTFTFLFRKGEPLIVIGPHCKIKKI
jgi:hypothetical protein